MVFPEINWLAELEPEKSPISEVLSGYLSVLELAQYRFETVLLEIFTGEVVLLA
jgi:hypothetical protein